VYLYIDEDQAELLLSLVKGVSLNSAELRELIPVEAEITSAINEVQDLKLYG
tara:strand:- start:12 stop:167 length:156 start_codon:yes stop_codon:yes gene_type:complete